MKVKRLALMGATAWLLAGLAHAQEFDKELEITLPLVVMINAQIGGAPVFGSGIVFGREKDRLYIVTANHVVRRGDAQATGIRVNLRSLPAKAIEARLLPQSDRELDIAVLAIDKLAAQGVEVCALHLDRLGDAGALRRGFDVYPVGNPNGAAWGMPVRPDQVSMVTGDEIAFQSPFLAVGVSGGALLDANARLLAIVRRDEPPYGLALSLDKALRAVALWGYPVQLWRAGEDGSTPLHKAVGDTAKVKALLGEACVDVNRVDESGRTPLHYAARTGNAEAVRLLLEAGAKVDAKGEYQITPLDESAGEGKSDAARLLLAAGADANAGDRGHWTPLYHAVHGGSLEVAKLLLEKGADVNKIGYGYSPLAEAVTSGTPEMVALLVASGADVNGGEIGFSQTDSRPPINIAADRGDPEILRQLIAAGAKVNAPSKAGETALESTISRRRLEAMRLLLAAGADPAARVARNEAKLLHLAAANGWVDGMKLLLDAGAPIDADGYLEETPLHAAVRSESAKAVNLLLAAGANFQLKKSGSDGSHKGDTPLCLAYSMINSGDTAARREVFNTLMAHSGAAINVLAGRAGCDLFDQAAARGDADTVKALLAAGASPTGRGSEAILSAAENGQVEIVKILVATKVNLNATDVNGFSALHATFARAFDPLSGDRVEVARLLLAAGAKANTITGYNQETPLHEAVRHHAPVEIVKLLLAAGVNPNLRNARSETALMIATELKETETAALLRSATAAGRKQPPAAPLPGRL